MNYDLLLLIKKHTDIIWLNKQEQNHKKRLNLERINKWRLFPSQNQKIYLKKANGYWEWQVSKQQAQFLI